MDFVGNYMSFLGEAMHFSAFPSISMCSCAFSMHPNWPLLKNIRQSRAILFILYGLESAFVVDSPILCVLNVIASNRP